VSIKSLKKHIGLAEREIHVWVYGYYDFPKPPVHGFPTAADPADRNFRYLVQPPNVPSLARLRGYHRPPRGGRGRCRRACERTPLQGRRRCPAGGRRRRCIICARPSHHHSYCGVVPTLLFSSNHLGDCLKERAARVRAR
jgi:hypothetical protein